MIQFELIEGVGKITLNRPDKYHSFIRKMALQLQNVLDKCNEDRTVRAILITATGKAFCAGQDLGEATDPNGPDLTQMVQEHYNPIIRKIRNIEKPVVAAVNGVAAGAGASIALCCDIVVATESASFIQAFSKIGLIPDSGGTFFLPRLVGMQKAAALMMTAEPVSAKDAESIGMIYKVFSDESFEKESWKLASKLAKMPSKGLGLTKRLLNVTYSNNLEQQLDMEDKCQTIAGNTADFKEGIEAFFEKRKPNFKGE
ncbi:MAG TPA: 2-(1,2-epoxy-1,2-dihydrophenyl)acetyl-CoA isomerase [Flavobacteriales bacterium]|nr:2-(1,2-epoxy-1,2-dihydrophenyl)acetyl-CoA isomerase [Flavobacteriales bacterium]